MVMPTCPPVKKQTPDGGADRGNFAVEKPTISEANLFTALLKFFIHLRFVHPGHVNDHYDHENNPAQTHQTEIASK
jgi:hypothetical protein